MSNSSNPLAAANTLRHLLKRDIQNQRGHRGIYVMLYVMKSSIDTPTNSFGTDIKGYAKHLAISVDPSLDYCRNVPYRLRNMCLSPLIQVFHLRRIKLCELMFEK